MQPSRAGLGGLAALAGACLLAEPVLAHAGSLSGSLRPAPVPSWLLVIAGGGVVAASFLGASLLTDHEAIRAVNARRVSLPWPFPEAAGRALRAASVLALAGLVLAGLFGPPTPTRNLAVLVVWAGWWAGYAMTTYLVGDSWPALNPWQGLAAWLPTRERTLAARPGAWPSAVGLLALVWVEVVSPVASDPRLLAVVVLGYTLVTLGGAWALGAGAWFERVDPVSRVFRTYGRLAPLQRTGTGLELRPPGGALADPDEPRLEGPFVLALLWATTYDGLVSTPAWNRLVGAVAGAGAPPLAVYAVALAGGYAAFLAVYRWAGRRARRSADTYVTAAYIRTWFLPALVPIAAGYHLAHFLGYFVSLSPALLAVVTHPLAPPASVEVAVLPDWFGAARLGFVVIGHLAGVWVAHDRAFELFPGRLRPIRSQYPFVLAMVLYTMTSMWILTQPFEAPAFV